MQGDPRLAEDAARPGGRAGARCLPPKPRTRRPRHRAPMRYRPPSRARASRRRWRPWPRSTRTPCCKRPARPLWPACARRPSIACPTRRPWPGSPGPPRTRGCAERAVKRLRSPELLASLALIARDVRVARAAARKLDAEQDLKAVARGAADRSVARQALERIREPALLKEVALASGHRGRQGGGGSSSRTSRS